MMFELYCIDVDGNHSRSGEFPDEERAIEAFDLIIEAGKVRAVFLDRTQGTGTSRERTNLKVWRKRRDNKASR